LGGIAATSVIYDEKVVRPTSNFLYGNPAAISGFLNEKCQMAPKGIALIISWNSAI
jgi:hypothetical protein